MASLKTRIANAMSRSPSPSPRNSTDMTSHDGNEADKYRLLITAGPSYDASTHQIVHVNTDTPTTISNEFIRAKIKVRIRGFHGLPSTCPSTSPYFTDPAHEKDQYSIAFSFVPKQDIPSMDVIWGNDFDHPVRDRLPPGFNTAFRIVKDFIDPGLECDAYADEPWLYGPALSCWFGFRVGEEISKDKELPEAEEAQDVLREGADGSGKTLREKHGIPDNNEKRRKFFLSSAHRDPFVFEKDRLYQADFYNPYLDFGNFALKLPGFSIKVIKYIDEKSHTLRYVFKNGKTGDVYFCINFNLLWGEKLQSILAGDQEQMRALAGAEKGGPDNEVKNRTADTEDRQKAKKSRENNEPEKRKRDPKAGLEAKEDGRNEGDDPGLKDKPEALREQLRNMDIGRTLGETSTGDERDGKVNVLNDVG